MDFKEVNTQYQPIGSFVRTAMKLFGIEVNSKRQLPSVDDGLKPSYRHIIYEELKTGDNLRKSVDIAGSCMSTTHAHGDQSLKTPIGNLVRWGISTGRGNHGKKLLWGEDSAPASMRYTEAKISKKFYKIFAPYLPYVPWIESEVKGTEPEYLPTPIPLVLLYGSQGIGLGVNCRIPAFSLESLVKALLKDDPNLLEAPFGLMIDKSKSELDALWNTGVGKICYKFKVEKKYLSDTWGYELSGQPEIFKPNLSKVERWVRDQKAFVIEESAQGVPKIFIAREFNIKSISHDDIKTAVEEAAQNIRTYRLTVCKDDKAFLIPLKEWLKYTMDNYILTMQKYKDVNIANLKFDRDVYVNLPAVAKLIYEHPEYDVAEVCKQLNIENPDVVSKIFSKSIGTLRRAESGSKIESIDAEIKKYESIVPGKLVIDILNEF